MRRGILSKKTHPMHHLILATLAATAITTLAATTQVYIGTGADGIYTTTLDLEKGTLTPPVRAAEMKATGFLAKHPTKPLLYSTGLLEKNKGAVAVYQIAPSGTLKLINTQPTGGKRLCHITLDHTSRMLMGANYGEGNVISYPIHKDGSIIPHTSLHQHQGSSVNPKRQTKPHAHSIYPGPNNKFAYAPDLGIDKVMIYTIDPATGTLTPSGHAAIPPGSGPRHMKFGKNGKFAYVLNELTLTISIFTVDATTGKLSPSQLLSTLPDGADKERMSCSEIRVSNDGKYIYCANRDLTEQGRDSISVFTVAPGGTLTRIQTTHAKVWIPRNINLDPSGKFLLVAGQKSNDIPVFKINPKNGKLSYTNQKITVPKAMCIEFANLAQP